MNSLSCAFFSFRRYSGRLIFQGRVDTVVDQASVERFADRQPDAQLVMLDDEHQLKGSLELIWQRTAPFLGLQPVKGEAGL